MNFLKKLFGKKSTPVDTKHSENLIRVHDEYGRELFIDKQTWLNDVLLENLKLNYGNPDALYNLLISALNDGFENHILDAGEQFFKVDPDKERGTCLYAIILMKNEKLELAENIIKDTLTVIGKSGILYTNLAKVYSQRGDDKSADETLWHALEVDPNQDNGLIWYAAIWRDRDGEPGYMAALKKVSDLPGAWRPQLWLARIALENKNKHLALSLYEQVFSRLENPSADVLQQVSGDLGLNGFIEEIINVVEPQFKIEVHGYIVGNNLIKAYIELKRYDDAKTLVSQLFAFNRRDWTDGLKYWQTQLEDITGNWGPIENSTEPKIAIWVVDKPVWLHKLPDTESLFPIKSENPIRIITTSASCSMSEASDQIVRQKTNIEGALCRAVPLTICDSLNLQTNSCASMLVPVFNETGFAFFGQRYDDEYVSKLFSLTPADIAVLPHLYADKDLWVYEVRIFRESSLTPIKIISTEFNFQDPAIALKKFIDDIYNFLVSESLAEILKGNLILNSITPNLYAHFIDANESSLALALACSVKDGGKTLYGERNIFDKLLILALQEPNSDVHKLMFTSALAKNKAYGSKIFIEYKNKLQKFIKDKPASPNVSRILDAAVSEIYSDIVN